jgi:MFS family permease
MYAVQAAAIAEMFPTRMRYSAVSLGYQVTSIFAGSLAPIIAVRLLETYKSSVPMAWYLAATAAVSAVAALVARETKGSTWRLSTSPTPNVLGRSQPSLSKTSSSHVCRTPSAAMFKKR